MEYAIGLAATIVALLAGLITGRKMGATARDQQREEAEKEAARILKEAEIKAETLRKEKELQARERFLQMKQEHESEANKRTQALVQNENRIKQKEQSLNQKMEQVARKEHELDGSRDHLKRQQEQMEQKKEQLDKQREELEKSRQKTVAALEKIAGLSAQDARAQLMEQMAAEAKSKAAGQLKEILDEAKAHAQK